MGGTPAPGFADPVRASQAHFRRLLEAMAHPGRVVELVGDLPDPPAGLMPGTFALALTLLDFETPLWLDEGARRAPIPQSLRFHCGCPVTADPASSAFAVVTDVAAMPPVASFAPGTPEYPDRSTTLLVEVAGLGRGGTRLRLRGPGIPASAILEAEGIDPRFAAELRSNYRRFPLGVDTVLVAGRRVAALPRSVEVEFG